MAVAIGVVTIAHERGQGVGETDSDTPPVNMSHVVDLSGSELPRVPSGADINAVCEARELDRCIYNVVLRGLRADGYFVEPEYVTPPELGE